MVFETQGNAQTIKISKTTQLQQKRIIMGARSGVVATPGTHSKQPHVLNQVITLQGLHLRIHRSKQAHRDQRQAAQASTANTAGRPSCSSAPNKVRTFEPISCNIVRTKTAASESFARGRNHPVVSNFPGAAPCLRPAQQEILEEH